MNKKLLESIGMDGRKNYYIAMEVAGPYALFARNDASGNADRSYPSPTYSGVINMFGSVMTWNDVRIIPIKVEICNMPEYMRFMFNDGGGLGDKNTQVSTHILRNVRYKMYARVDGYRPDYNPRHAFQTRFNCRLKYKKKLHNPFLYLGRREFRAEYFGHLDPETSPCLDFNQEIRGMFKQIGKNGNTETFPLVTINAGTLVFPQ